MRSLRRLSRVGVWNVRDTDEDGPGPALAASLAC